MRILAAMPDAHVRRSDASPRPAAVAVVAVAAGPELVGKWDLTLVPEGQERFVYHAARA